MKLITTALISFLIFPLHTIAADYFWVGDSGSWSDLNHWSTTSGGTTKYLQVPTPNDDVHFDANSFTSAGAVVDVNVGNAVCRDLDWTGVTNNPSFQGVNQFRIYGSLKLVSTMTWNYTGALSFEATSTGKTITTAGNALLNACTFNGIGGEWILQDNLVVNASVTLNNGHFSTNGKNVECTQFASTTSAARQLTIANSVFRVRTGYPSWDVLGSNLTLAAQGSLIRLQGEVFSHQGPGKIYNDVFFEQQGALEATRCTFRKVEFTGTFYSYGGFGNKADSMILNSGVSAWMSGHYQDTINVLLVHGLGTVRSLCKIGVAKFFGNASFKGANEFDTLLFTAGKIYTLQNGFTQKINNDFIALGNCTNTITIESSTSGAQATFQKSSGNVTITYASLKDIKGAGGATFTANNSANLGNNSGWIINSAASLQLYWIGGSGNWNDPAHWSTSSGGAGGACIPTANDDVHFDANSFTSAGAVVDVNVGNAVCRDLDWTGVTNNPSFQGVNQFRIYGSLKLVSTMTWNYTGALSFEATSTGRTITTAGNALLNACTFNGIGGEWILQDNLVVNASVTLNNGHFSTNGKNVECNQFLSTVSTARQLTIANSVFKVKTGYPSWDVSGSNLTLAAQGSLIRLQGEVFSHQGPGKIYNDVFFEQQGALEATRCTFRKVEFTGTFYSYGGFGNKADSMILNSGVSAWMSGHYQDTINVLLVHGLGTVRSLCKIGVAKFFGNASFKGANRFNTLIFTAGNTYILQSGTTQVVEDSLSIRGNGCFPITLQSSNAGSRSTISKASGIVAGDFIEMRDQNATGGAQFYAGGYSTSVSNNIGWNFNNGPGYNYGLGPDISFCKGDINSFILNTDNFNGGTSWLWNTGATTPDLAVSQTGKYWVNVIFGNNCFFADTIHVTAIVTPPLTATSNSPVCLGSSINLSASSGSSYNWSGPSGFTSNQQFPSIPNASPIHAGKYFVRNIENGCRSEAADVDVIIGGSLTASVTITASHSAICPGSQITFSAAAINGGFAPVYQWQVNGVNTGSNNSSFTTTALSNGDVVKCILTSNSTCVSSPVAESNSIIVSVVNSITAGVTISANTSSFCSGTPVTFTALPTNGGTAPQYQWIVNGVIAGSNGPGFTSSTLNNGDNVKCILTSNSTCVSTPAVESNSIIVSVVNTITPGITISATTSSLCAGTAVSFTATATHGGTAPIYQWTVNGINVGSDNPAFVSSTLNNGDEIKCMLTSNAACLASASVTSNPIIVSVSTPVTPAISISTTNTSVCAGTPVSFSAAVSGGGNAPLYEWQVNGTAVGNSLNYSTTTLQNGDVIKCILTSNAACAAPGPVSSNQVVMTVNAPVTPAIVIAADGNSVCAGTPITFSATAINGGISPVFRWTVNGSAVGTNIATFSSAALLDGDVVQCALTSSAACISGTDVFSNAIVIRITPPLSPSIIIASDRNTICPGDRVQFTALAQNAGTSPSYLWKVNGIVSGTNTSLQSSSLAGGDVITCTISATGGCFNTTSVTSNAITILSAPVLSKPTLTVLRRTETSVEVGWLPVAGATSYQVSINNTPYASPSGGSLGITHIISGLAPASSLSVRVKANGALSCSDATSDLLTVSTLPASIPNTFTPNGDGINDTWKIEKLQAYPNCTVSVYDRFGRLVFVSKGYSNPWNGMVRNNKTPASTYYYIISLGNGESVSGWLQVLY